MSVDLFDDCGRLLPEQIEFGRRFVLPTLHALPERVRKLQCRTRAASQARGLYSVVELLYQSFRQQDQLFLHGLDDLMEGHGVLPVGQEIADLAQRSSLDEIESVDAALPGRQGLDGPRQVAATERLPIHIDGMAARRFDDERVAAEAKGVLRRVIRYHLGAKPLNTRRILQDLKQL